MTFVVFFSHMSQKQSDGLLLNLVVPLEINSYNVGDLQT